MSNIQQYRSVPDLLDMIRGLEKRLSTMETNRRLGSSSIDNGSLIVNNGDVVIKDDTGVERVKLTHGINPSTYYRAANASDAVRARQVAFADGSGVTNFQSYIVRDSDGAGDGGKLVLSKDYTYLSHQPASGEETFIGLSAYAAYNNHFLFRGKWISDDQFASWNSVYMGTVSIAAGFGAYSQVYDYPYPTTPLVLYTITGATANFNHCLVNSDANGFTIGWSNVLAHDINYLILRR
jgi:hypothetical protein